METPTERRVRVTRQVYDTFPVPLNPNRFLNAVLDIIRGGYGFSEHDRLEAVDALTEIHLPHSVTIWKT